MVRLRVVAEAGKWQDHRDSAAVTASLTGLPFDRSTAEIENRARGPFSLLAYSWKHEIESSYCPPHVRRPVALLLAKPSRTWARSNPPILRHHQSNVVCS